MSTEEPELDFERNTTGVPTTPRPAATVILLKDGPDGLEVLLVRRNPGARFMGGAWVFPGGTVHAGEGAGQPALRKTAVRELREEAGITVAEADLTPFARWITPEISKLRFDTWFYLAPAPHVTKPSIDGEEIVGHGWWAPRAALAAHEAGELKLAFPTVKQLQQLSHFSSTAELLAHARGHRVDAVVPLVTVEGETARILLPGDPGYEPPA